MVADAVDRLTHIKETVGDIRRILAGKTVGELQADVLIRAAFERLIEVISEASRHIPADWKQEFGVTLPWRNIANVGNVIRQAYDHVEVGILWSIYTDDLDPLEAAIDAMLAAHGDAAPT